MSLSGFFAYVEIAVYVFGVSVQVGLVNACFFFFFQAEDGIRDVAVTGAQTCALPIGEKSFYVGSRPSEKPRAPCANVRRRKVSSLDRRPRSGTGFVNGRRSKKKSKHDKKRRKNNSASIAPCCPSC